MSHLRVLSSYPTNYVATCPNTLTPLHRWHPRMLCIYILNVTLVIALLIIICLRLIVHRPLTLIQIRRELILCLSHVTLVVIIIIIEWSIDCGCHLPLVD